MTMPTFREIATACVLARLAPAFEQLLAEPHHVGVREQVYAQALVAFDDQITALAAELEKVAA